MSWYGRSFEPREALPTQPLRCRQRYFSLCRCPCTISSANEPFCTCWGPNPGSSTSVRRSASSEALQYDLVVVASGFPLLLDPVTTTKRRKRLQPRELGAHSSRAAPAMFPARSFARRAASAGPLGRRSTREQQMRSRPRSTQPRRLARAARSRAASPSQVCPVQTGQLPKQPAFRGAASRVDGTFPILSPPEKRAARLKDTALGFLVVRVLEVLQLDARHI